MPKTRIPSIPPIVPLRPPKGAPNVLIVLIDEWVLVHQALSAARLTRPRRKARENGLKYNRFHTCALCSPTRQALLTGRNHHTVGMGGIRNGYSAPGNCSLRPKSCAPLAETLKLNGYSTAQFGKCHEVPPWETSPAGPFTWPTGSGFEYFYGFVCAESNQYYPAIYEGTTPVEPDKTPEEGYHFTIDLTNKAIKWVRQQKSLMPDKPFFMYLHQGQPTLRITFPKNGRTSTKASSTKAGINYERRLSHGKRNSALFLQIVS